MWSVLSLAFIIGFSILAKLLSQNISVHVASKDLNKFSGERAFRCLKEFNDIGPKSTGSDNNEIKAVDFLLKEFESIKTNLNKNQKISLDHQIVSGKTADTYSYNVEFRNIQNVIIKLLGENEHNSILVNSHFDSVPGSYGASDDSANLCIMLEILKVLSKKETRQKYSAVFLFNGAEEQGLLGAQAFMENYEDIKDISAFVNLESTGSGGREILFQSSPKNYLLVEHYKNSVKRPFGQSTADELFKSGLIPAATDYEIFVNYKSSNKSLGLTGLDFAQFKDGYRYHTKNDHVKYLSADQLQHTGENILELLLSLTNAEEMPLPEGKSAIYFDYLGAFFVAYTSTTGIIFNILVSLFAMCIPVIWQSSENFPQNVIPIAWRTASVVFVCILSTGFSLLAAYLLALIFGATGKTMTWYTSTFLAPGIYSSITVLTSVFIYHMYLMLIQKFSSDESEVSVKVKHNMNGINFLFGILIIIGTALGIQSTYLLTVILFISLIFNVLTVIVELGIKFWMKRTKKFQIGGDETADYWQMAKLYSWVILHCLGQLPIVLWVAYIYFIVLELFIPIAGKSGGNYVNPDILIGIISALCTSLMILYFLPLIEFLRRKIIVYGTLIILFLVFLIVAMTGVGFPYSGNENYPTPQRHYISNMQRIVQDSSGKILKQDSGLVFEEVDFNSRASINDFIKPNTFLDNSEDEFCELVPFCGFSPFSKRNKGGHYLINDLVPTVNETKIKLISKSSNMKFSFVGKYSTKLYIAGGKSNLHGVKSDWNENPVEIVDIVFGKENFSDNFFEIEPFANSSEISITVITVDSILLDEPPTTKFKDFLETLPDWTYTVPATAVSRTFKFEV